MPCSGRPGLPAYPPPGLSTRAGNRKPAIARRSSCDWKIHSRTLSRFRRGWQNDFCRLVRGDLTVKSLVIEIAGRLVIGNCLGEKRLVDRLLRQGVVHWIIAVLRLLPH